MADEEQFSLCWNNFNTNLSAGFHESLCRGDLVDVTLAAEGQLVKAHRLVLSVCSPYFRKMFTQMPANQHAFCKFVMKLCWFQLETNSTLSLHTVFMKDVSASVLKDLIQFMYCGEVNVKQDQLPSFISTAEALQIKGLTEGVSRDWKLELKLKLIQNFSLSQTQIESAGVETASPTKETITSTPLPDSGSLRRGTRFVAARAQQFKIESEGSSDERQTVTLVQTQSGKRTARPIAISAPKRIKVQQATQQATDDPLDESEDIGTKVSEATEFIDLPIESTKAEPEYVEDTQEIETEQDEDQYVDEVTYGDDSYFTEGDEKAAGVSGFSETYAEGDQTTEAQG